jgi:hypothetical protein
LSCFLQQVLAHSRFILRQKSTLYIGFHSQQQNPSSPQQGQLKKRDLDKNKRKGKNTTLDEVLQRSAQRETGMMKSLVGTEH